MSHIKYLSSALLKSHEMTLHAFHKVGVVLGGTGGRYIYASLNIYIYNHASIFGSNISPYPLCTYRTMFRSKMMIAEAHCENQLCLIIYKVLRGKRELVVLLLPQCLDYSQPFFPLQTNYYLFYNYYFNYYLVCI